MNNVQGYSNDTVVFATIFSGLRELLVNMEILISVFENVNNVANTKVVF